MIFLVTQDTNPAKELLTVNINLYIMFGERDKTGMHSMSSKLRPRKVELVSAHKRYDDYCECFTHNNEACKNPYKTTLLH